MHRFLPCILVLFLAACATGFTASGPSGGYEDTQWSGGNSVYSLEEGRVSTGSEPGDALLLWLLTEKRIRVFVSLKGEIAESKKELIRSHGATLHTFRWSAGRVPPEEEIIQVFQLMQAGTRESPVHVFCRAGVDRTGYARAYYRYYAEGWSARQALFEMYSFWHFPNVLDRDLKRRFKEFPNNRRS